MRCIFVGIEYAGKSTLVNLLTNYYQHRKLRVHVDDHFTIPDSTLSPGIESSVRELPRRREGTDATDATPVSR